MRPVDSPGRHVCSGCGRRLIDTDSGRGSKELRYELATLWYDAICFELWQEERAKLLQLWSRPSPPLARLQGCHGQELHLLVQPELPSPPPPLIR